MTWLRECGRRPVRLVAAASVALALTACNGSDDERSGSREAEYKRVVEDPHPGPADVIEAAGAPSGVVRADDGSLLLTYYISNVEDDEGPAASAWRIVDSDGRTVAEHAEHTDAEAGQAAFKGIRGGFLQVPPGVGAGEGSVLDVHGKRRKVVVTEAALRTRPGDILLVAPEPILIYRPATRTVAPPAGVWENAIRLAADERGTVWSLGQPVAEEPFSVVWQRGGRTLGRTVVPKPYRGGALTARGGTAALSLTQGHSTRGLLVTTDGGGHWKTVLDGGIPFSALKRGPEWLVMQVFTDGRLLVGEEDGRYWVADDRTNSRFYELKTPAKFTSLTVDGTTIYGIADATTATYDLVKGEGLWISRDAGREWRRYQQRG